MGPEVRPGVKEHGILKGSGYGDGKKVRVRSPSGNEKRKKAPTRKAQKEQKLMKPDIDRRVSFPKGSRSSDLLESPGMQTEQTDSQPGSWPTESESLRGAQESMLLISSLGESAVH